MNYKVIVVEDELPILNNVVRKLNNLNLPLTVVGTATNGEDALELVHMHRPHILITDIRMPGMNGLTLCKNLYKQYPEIKLLILSGYDDFSYAQEAIRYQIYDYLLKPVNITQLQETLDSLCKLLDSEMVATQRRALLMGVSGQTEQNQLPCYFGTKPLGVTLICIGNLLNIPPEDVDLEYFNYLWEKLDLDSFLQKYIQAEDQFWILPEKRPNERFLITSFFDPALPKILSEHAESLFQNKVHISFCTIPHGIPYQDIWETAQKERTYLRSHLVPCHSDIYIEGKPDKQPVISVEKEISLIISSICEHQQNYYQSAVSSFLKTLYDADYPQPLLENALETILKALHEHSSFLDNFSQFRESILYEICMQNNCKVLYRYLYTLLSDAFVQAFRNVLTGDSLADAIKKYIDENYKKPITMELLVELFHFSDSYIGRIFRNQFQVPPMKYLVSLRMEEACRLIKDNNGLNIGLIGEMVGYNDQRYFSRLFRNATGYTPSDYKKKFDTLS